MGILLPALESMRRGLGEWAVDFTTMFEDHVAGALLLVGASVPSRAAWERENRGLCLALYGESWFVLAPRRHERAFLP